MGYGLQIPGVSIICTLNCSFQLPRTHARTHAGCKEVKLQEREPLPSPPVIPTPLFLAQHLGPNAPLYLVSVLLSHPLFTGRRDSACRGTKTRTALVEHIALWGPFKSRIALTDWTNTKHGPRIHPEGSGRTPPKKLEKIASVAHVTRKSGALRALRNPFNTHTHTLELH